MCASYVAVMFSENVTHGTMRWRSATERRALSYSYMPAYLSAGPSQPHAGHEVSLHAPSLCANGSGLWPSSHLPSERIPRLWLVLSELTVAACCLYG